MSRRSAMLGACLMLLSCRKSHPHDVYFNDKEFTPRDAVSMCEVEQEMHPKCGRIVVAFAEEILKNGEPPDDDDCLRTLRVLKRFGNVSRITARLQRACCPLRSATLVSDEELCPAGMKRPELPAPPMSPMEKEVAYLADWRGISEFSKLEHCAQSATPPCDQFVREYAAGLIQSGDPSGGLGCYEALLALRPRAAVEENLRAKLQLQCCPLRWQPAHGADRTLCR